MRERQNLNAMQYDAMLTATLRRMDPFCALTNHFQNRLKLKLLLAFQKQYKLWLSIILFS
jgi:hypothetical protein